MADEKDRLGDTLKKRGRGEEEKYFAEQDRQRLARLRAEQAAAEKTTVTGRCPRCGEPLGQREARGITVDECGGGCGVWLDKGELEHLGGSTEDRSSLITSILGDLGIVGKTR